MKVFQKKLENRVYLRHIFSILLVETMANALLLLLSTLALVSATNVTSYNSLDMKSGQLWLIQLPNVQSRLDCQFKIQTSDSVDTNYGTNYGQSFRSHYHLAGNQGLTLTTQLIATADTGACAVLIKCTTSKGGCAISLYIQQSSGNNVISGCYFRPTVAMGLVNDNAVVESLSSISYVNNFCQSQMPLDYEMIE